MLNNLTKGIIAKIYADLGDKAKKYKYYDNGINQNFKTPCFYPHILTPRLTRRFGGGYEYSVPFVVHYFPQDPSNKVEMNDIGDFLLRSLETITITVGKLGLHADDEGVPVAGEYVGEQIVRGTDIYFTVEEDRVLCRVTYRLLTQTKPTSVDEMADISFAETVKQ